MYFPKWFVRPFAAPYVAGETLKSALDTVRELNQDGFCATLDILGEHVQSEAESFKIRDAYINLFQSIKKAGLDSNVSLKPTHLGLGINYNLALKNLLAILNTAKETDNFMRIDMENSDYTDATINAYQECYTEYNQVGPVFQAYMKRTGDDISELNTAEDFNCRICKGIYRESPNIAFQDREAIRTNFIKATQALLTGPGYVGIATHDITLIDTLETWIRENDIPKTRFEFQVLYGVPMGDRLKKLLEVGYKVRVYVPCGEAWFDYAIRRLKENPNILWYILGNIFKR
ncbi:MAG: proline dehydrogenase family protein [Candidatus Neomarinimicrobiota bacterium]